MTDTLTEFKENDIIECIDSFLIYVTVSLTRRELDILNSRLGLNYRYYNNEKSLCNRSQKTKALVAKECGK